MKIDGKDWLDWLHEMRREEEAKRIREGVSMAEWLRRVNAEADAAMAQVTGRGQPSAVRDKPAT